MSDIGQLRQAAAEARSGFDAALTAADAAQKSRTYYAFQVERWKLSHPAEANIREPRPIDPGVAHYDIAMVPPPSDEQVAAFEKAVGKAEKRLDKATKALAAAVAAGPPRRKPSTTGYAATKNFRFLGVSYNVGDEFDPGIAEPGKFAKLIGSRKVAATSLPGHGS